MRLPARIGALLALLCAAARIEAAPPLAVELVVDEPELRENIERSLSVLAALRDGERDPELLLRLHARAEPEIRRAAEALGWYEPGIDIRLDRQRKPMQARYAVTAGPRVRLEAVDLRIRGDGAQAPELRAYIDRAAPRPGDPLHHGRYEEFKSGLLATARREGWLDARWTRHRILVDVARRSARIELELDTGPRYRVGSVQIEQGILDADVVRRYVPVQPGDVLRIEQLLAARFALADLGWFSSVDLVADPAEAQDGAIPVRFSTTPLAQQRYRVGVGYGTDTGLRGLLGTEWRWLNRRGHRLEAELRASELGNSLAAGYRIPLGTRVGEQLGLDAVSTQETVADLITRRTAVAVSLTRIPGDWRRRWYLRHEREDFSGAQQGSTKLTMPGLTIDRTALDDAVRARSGWALRMDVHGAARGLLSDTGFAQFHLAARAALPMPLDGRLLLRAEGGATVLEEFSALPPSQRFFAGGDESVRGYAYRSLGPRNPDGEVIGGAFLATGSAEFEVPVAGGFGAALFVDAGGVDDNPAVPLSVGAGLGLRYFSPVGAIRVDLAHPFDGRRRGVRLHLGIRVGL